MRIMIMDGQGGGVGKSIAERLLSRLGQADARRHEFIVVGTNAVATSNMMRAGVSTGATGENAVVYNAARAQILVGPIGIVLPNAMYGEITTAMAVAVADSPAKKILIPVSNLHATIVGLAQKPMGEYVEEAVAAVTVELGEMAK